MIRLKGLRALAALLGSIAGAVHGPAVADPRTIAQRAVTPRRAEPRPEKPRRKIPNPEKQAAAQAKRERKNAKRGRQ